MVTKKSKSRGNDKILLVLFMTLALGTILFVVSTDVFSLLSVSGLTLDATNSRGSADQRGVDASSGQFTGQGNIGDFIERFKDRLDDFFNKFDNNKLKFKEPKAPKEPKCKNKDPCSAPPPEPLPPTPPTIPPFPTTTPVDPVEVIDSPTVITVIDLRTGNTQDVAVVDGVKGGGALSSSTEAGGVQELIRDKIVVHERFHTPANGQTVTGSLLIDWGHGGSITVQQFLVPNAYFDWFEFDLPQTIRGDGALSFDGISQGEFFYKLTVPDDLIDKDTVIPVRLIISSQNSVVDGVTEIQIERPQEESTTFSVAELFRSLFTEIRIVFA